MLRGLELSGFKTFAQRTRLEFRPGLTAIVGPNGSGKSNLADALRWVLTEPAGRGLRVRRAEELLFAGGAGRPPAGFAEVSVILDNAARRLPLEADEVVITRRLYRSGESECWVNGSRVRQREVVDLLSRLGLAQSAYAIIGQGLVDAALSLRPEERRELIEEAADLRRHQAALAEARTRLEATRLNLQRLDDLLAELRPRLERLARQAAEAQEHRRLTEELAALLAAAYRARWQVAQTRLTAAEQAEEAAAAALATARAAAQQVSEERAALHAAAAASRQHHETILAELRAVEAVADRARHEAAYAARNRERLAAEVSRLEREVTDWAARVASEAAALAAAEQELAHLRAEQAAFPPTSGPRESPAAEQALEAARQRVQEVRRRLADLEAELRATAALRERLAAELNTLSDLPAAPPSSAGEAAQLAAQATALEEQLHALQQEREATEARLADLREQEATTRAAAAALAERRREAERRLAQLAREEAAGDFWTPAVRAVLEEAGRLRVAPGRAPAARLNGIIGTVADLIRVPAGYELAFEAALGARAQDVVVASWRDAEAAIAFLRASGAGRATFLPLDTIRPGRRAEWPPEPGVHGVAAALCQYDPAYQAVIDRLLGMVVVVDDLLVARRCLARNGRGHQFVTLQGEIVGSWGAISGGSRPSQREGLMRRRAELAILTRERDQLTTRVAEVERKLAAIGQALARERAALADLRTRRDELEQARAAVQRQLARREAEQEQARLAAETATRQQQRRQALEAEAQTLATRAAQLEAAIAASRVALQEADAAQSAAERVLSAVREREQAAAARQAQVRALEQAALATCSRLEASLERARASEQRARDLLAELRAQQAEAEAEGVHHQQRAEAALQRAADLQQQVRQLGEQLRQLEAALERAQQAEQAAGEAVVSASERFAEARRERELAAEALEMLQARMLADGLEPTALAAANGPTGDPEELERRALRLRARLRALPPTSYHVIAEYAQERERVEHQQAQADDLRQAEANLTRTIASLEALIAERFEETVAAVNREFRRAFQQLFGGGTARLHLTESAGVEIEAHPPGKRPQGLAMLSGGERALTAAALLLALLRVRPVPFCVLDEVDAALDERNLVRFLGQLRELSTLTQVLVITHNRLTVEAASSVYGVAIGADGCSRVVSLALEEASWPARPGAG